MDFKAWELPAFWLSGVAVGIAGTLFVAGLVKLIGRLL